MTTGKFVCAAALAALVFGANPAFAETIDRRLEQRIHAAVKPIAERMGLVRDTGPNVNQTAGVAYTNERDCDGASYCTILVVYYDQARNCSAEWRPGFQRGSGKMRDIYNLKHKNVCYQISVHGRLNAQAVANALKANM